MEYRHLIKHVNPEMWKRWTRSFTNESRNIAKGVGEPVKGTNNIFFIKHEEIPAYWKALYGQIVVHFWPKKIIHTKRASLSEEI